MGARTYNRREFLLALGGAGAAIGLSVSGGCGGRDAPRISLGPGGLEIAGKTVPLYSGGLDYWSYDRENWEPLLDRLSRLGINTVGVSVPWSEHELASGELEFGRRDPRRDVAGFIELAGRKQFNVILRLGPFHRLASGRGIPDRILYDQRVAARTGRDTCELCRTPTSQFPVPSIFSRTFQHELGLWFDELALRISPALNRSGGPVVALMLESALSFFGTIERPYSVDYHPDLIGMYRSALTANYVTIDQLNRVYGTAYLGFEMVEPPREFLAQRLDNLPAYLEWVEFRRTADIMALDTLERMLAARGIDGVPVIRKAPVQPVEITGQAKPEEAEAVEAPPTPVVIPGETRQVRSMSRMSAGSSTYPFSDSLAGGVQFPAMGGIPSAAECEFNLMVSLMYGIKGWDSRSLVDKNAWLASPVSGDGRMRGEYFNSWRRVCRVLRESHFHQYRRLAGVVLLKSRSLDTLLTAANEARLDDDLLELDAPFGRLADMGFETPVQACRLWAGQVESLMGDVGFDWDYATAGFAGGKLSEYRVAILPATDFIHREEALALEEYVHSGGTLIYGPGKPFLDERMRPNSRADRLFGGLSPAGGESRDSVPSEDAAPARAIRLESPLEIGDLLKGLDVPLPFTRTNPRVELSVHTHPAGRMILFAANGTDRPQRTDIFFQGRYGFRDLQEHSTFSGEGKIRVELQPRRVQAWEVSA